MTATGLLLSDLYCPIREELGAVERIFDDEIRSELPFVNDLCARVRSYRGKMMRPALLLLAGKATGELSHVHHILGAVVELVHMATLVHDDVLDDADERRGQHPVHAVAGNVAAVLLGDFLISHAFHLCSQLGDQHASRRIGATTNVVCEGELLQNRHRGDIDMDDSLYLDIVGRKTGALTAVCCELGARYAGADGQVVDAMYAYGMSAGIAFQIVDDVLDVVGDRADVRKTLESDLRLGKPTLPTIHGMAHADVQGAALLRHAVAGEASIEPRDLRTMLTEIGSVAFALETATGFAADAVARLDPLPSSDAKASLSALAEFIVQRHT